MAVPGVVFGLGYVLSFNAKPIVLTNTMAILVIILVMTRLPVGVRSSISSLRQIDPSIEEAAQDVGAGTTKVFSSITIPLIKPAFFSSWVFSFIKSMYYAAGRILSCGGSVLLDNNFENRSVPSLEKLILSHPCNVITVKFGGDVAVIYQRFMYGGLQYADLAKYGEFFETYVSANNGIVQKGFENTTGKITFHGVNQIASGFAS